MIKQNSIPKKTIICSVWKKTFPHRDINSKWYVTYKEYPEKTYPEYCGGFFFLMTNDIIEVLHKELIHTKFYWIDDVWLTGIVANRINVTLQCRKDLIVEQEIVEKINSKLLKLENLFGGHLGNNINKITILWNYLLPFYLNSNNFKKLNQDFTNLEIDIQLILIFIILIYFLFFSSIIKIGNF